MYLGCEILYTKVVYNHNIANYMNEAEMAANRIYKFVDSLFMHPQKILRT